MEWLVSCFPFYSSTPILYLFSRVPLEPPDRLTFSDCRVANPTCCDGPPERPCLRSHRRPHRQPANVVCRVSTRTSVVLHRGGKHRLCLHLDRAPNAIAIDNGDLAELRRVYDGQTKSDYWSLHFTRTKCFVRSGTRLDCFGRLISWSLASLKIAVEVPVSTQKPGFSNASPGHIRVT